ncbi:protein kinase domain-containing protein [Streptomyces sp. T028]|uniref:protein kinase domain-containing protein n=1 Tax=Streptomyces sp. T028 TaxID=3394379 RepID=UPI003A8BB82E
MTHQRPTPPSATAAEAAALRQTGASPLRVGDPGRVGPYVPLALLGSGGMGRVYLARAADDGPGLFAVKVIRPEYAEDVRFQRRFEREAAVHSRLGPPYAPRLCGTGFEGELLWMATEYIPGLDLTEAVRGAGALPAATVWRLVGDLGRALAALSAAGVVHRDLKPSNVLLSVQGAHLIDFGISKAADASALTGTGNRVGTPAYMSPEYLRTGQCDAASDVFSLAGTLVYASAGRAPFGDGTGVDVMHRVAFEEPDPKVTAVVASADPDLAALLARCLAKEPGLRPTAGELIELAGARTGADGWPEPLHGEVLARQGAYQTLHRLPVERAVRLFPSVHRPTAPRTPAPAPVSRPAPPGVAAAPMAPSGAGAVPMDPHAPVGALAVPAGAPVAPVAPSAPSSPSAPSAPVDAPASSELAAAQPEGGVPASAESSASGQQAPSASREATSEVLPPKGPPGSRRWTHRQRVMVVAAGAALCAVAAGGLVLTRPDGPGTAAPPRDVETATGAVPGAAPGKVALPGTSGVPDRASAAGSAAGRADVDGGLDPTRPDVSGSTTADSAAGAPASSGADTGAGTGTSSAPSTDPTTPSAEPWNTDCTYYNGNGRTGEGDSGKKVSQVQCMLMKRGYSVGSSGVTGEFGPETTDAVRAFQGDKDLSADGVVAHDTWVALRGSD